MASVIAVYGESGSGKTTSLRNLDPSYTFIIDADEKGLPWRGWRSQFNAENKNYIRANTQALAYQCMKQIDTNEAYAHVKVLVIDTLNGIMVEEERIHKDEKGYDKWSDLAWNVWDIVRYANIMRDDLTVVMFAHAQVETDDNGYRFLRIKTSGRKLSKLTLESKLQNLYYAYRDEDGSYLFRVKSKNDVSKCSHGLYDCETVPNDMLACVNALREFEWGDAMPPLKEKGAADAEN